LFEDAILFLDAAVAIVERYRGELDEARRPEVVAGSEEARVARRRMLGKEEYYPGIARCNYRCSGGVLSAEWASIRPTASGFYY
jgi:hypothetical protein